MQKTEYFCFGWKFSQSIQTILKLFHIMTLKFFAGHIKYMDKYFNLSKNMISLTLEELLHEKILPSTIPKLENKIT